MFNTMLSMSVLPITRTHAALKVQIRLRVSCKSEKPQDD